MRVLETSVEPITATTVRVTSVIDISATEPAGDEGSATAFGDGPTGDAVPDRIVRFLIERAPEDQSVAEIQRAVGGNPGTVNRQAWTLATNAPDLQIRLRGWVRTPGRGLYGLTPAALRQIGRQST